jgi:kynureninase
MTDADIAALDAEDPLAPFRERFVLPDNLIYLDGNSLGPAPKAAFDDLKRVIEKEWAEGLIASWNNAGWFASPKALGDRLRKILGAAPEQTIVCDTTSINIYKAVSAALGLRPDRNVIVSELDSFPTDLYMIEGLGAEVRLLGRDGDVLEDLIDDRVGVVLLSHVNYRTGSLFDMANITRIAHDAGALIVWDLCHTVGILPITLDADEVDFAVGCTYKYLNGGPGAPAFIYVARRYIAEARQPLSGWWGHARPFAFEPEFDAHGGIEKFLCGTQPIISMRGVEAGLDALDGVGMEMVREKSLALTDLFMELCEPLCQEYGLRLVTPRNDSRGSQVSFIFEHGYAVIRAMIERGVIGDFREPGLMRFGFAPLYLRYVDIHQAVKIMADCLAGEVWKIEAYSNRAAVT